jgi:hypothetical protein
MSSSALALGVGLFVVMAQLRRAHRRDGWAAVKSELKTDAWHGAAVCLGIWTALFFVFLGAAIYQDHGYFKAVVKKRTETIFSERKTNGDASKRCEGDVSGLKESIAVQQAVGRTLEKQNRDEQVLIAGCQNQALKLLVPTQLVATGIVLDRNDDNTQARRISWLVLVNKSLTPTHLSVVCTQGVNQMLSASLRILVSAKGGVAFGGINAKLANNAWELGSDETWSDKAPIIVDFSYRGDPQKVACAFIPR